MFALTIYHRGWSPSYMLTKYYNNHSRFKIRSIKGFVKMRGLTKKTHTQKKKIGDGNSTNNH